MVRSLRRWAALIIRRDSKVWNALKGLRAERRVRRLQANSKKIQSTLDAFSRARRDVFFIQIGASDGITGDPIHPLIERDGWSGILVEPVRYTFDRLRANYRDHPNLIFENVAVSRKHETRDFWYLKESKDLPVGYDQLGSFLPEVLLKHSHRIPNIEDYLVKAQIECVPLEALIQKHDVKKVDVLHIDTEGYDFEVIKQIDFERVKPSMILYEHKHLNLSDREECADYLRRNGYKLIQGRYDTLAFIGDVEVKPEHPSAATKG